jgi:hypothetical protein
VPLTEAWRELRRTPLLGTWVGTWVNSPSGRSGAAKALKETEITFGVLCAAQDGVSRERAWGFGVGES